MTNLKFNPILKVLSLFSNTEVCLLSSLRSYTLRGIRGNFKQMYGGDIYCPLKCWQPHNLPELDTQPHILSCSKLRQSHKTNKVACTSVQYSDIYGDVSAQKSVISVISELLIIRERRINDVE